MTVSWPSQENLLDWIESDLNNWGRWGKDDQKGTLNHLSEEKTLEALELVSEGASVSCARPVEFKASIDVPRPPQHFMVSAGDTYRKGESSERQVAVMGSDTGNDVAPNPYDLFTNPVHQVGIVGLGLWILDNAWLDDLAKACSDRGKWEFMISILPLKMPTVTGSPVNPLVIY